MILCQQALSNTQCMMENIIKSTVCHASDFLPKELNCMLTLFDLFMLKCPEYHIGMLLRMFYQFDHN